MVKIADMKLLNEAQKAILAICSRPRTGYEIAAKLGKSYSSINQNLGILKAHKLIKKISKLNGGVLYKKADEVEL